MRTTACVGPAPSRRPEMGPDHTVVPNWLLLIHNDRAMLLESIGTASADKG